LNSSRRAAVIFTPHSETAPIGSFFICTAKETLISSKGVLPSAPAMSYYMLDVQLLLLPQCVSYSEQHGKKSTMQPRTNQTHFYIHRNVSLEISFIINQLEALISQNLFCHETLHVSDSFFVHHQEFIHFTLRNGVCHTSL